MKKKIIIGLSCLAFSTICIAACGTSTGGTTATTSSTATSTTTTTSTNDQTTTESVNETSTVLSSTSTSSDGDIYSLDSVIKYNGPFSYEIERRDVCYFDRSKNVLTLEPVVFTLDGEILNNKSSSYFIPSYFMYEDPKERTSLSREIATLDSNLPENILDISSNDTSLKGIRNLDGRSYICIEETTSTLDGTKTLNKIYTLDGNVIFETEEDIQGFNIDEQLQTLNGYSYSCYYGVRPNDEERYFITNEVMKFDAGGYWGTIGRNSPYYNIYKIENNSVKKIDSKVFLNDSVASPWYLGDGCYVTTHDPDSTSINEGKVEDIKKDGKTIIHLSNPDDDKQYEVSNVQYDSNYFAVEGNNDIKLFDINGNELLYLQDASSLGGSKIESARLLTGSNSNGYIDVYFRNKDNTRTFEGIIDKNGSWVFEPQVKEESPLYGKIVYAFDDVLLTEDTIYDNKLNVLQELNGETYVVCDGKIVFILDGKLNAFDLKTKQLNVLYEKGKGLITSKTNQTTPTTSTNQTTSPLTTEDNYETTISSTVSNGSIIGSWTDGPDSNEVSMVINEDGTGKLRILDEYETFTYSIQGDTFSMLIDKYKNMGLTTPMESRFFIDGDELFFQGLFEGQELSGSYYYRQK